MSIRNNPVLVLFLIIAPVVFYSCFSGGAESDLLTRSNNNFSSALDATNDNNSSYDDTDNDNSQVTDCQTTGCATGSYCDTATGICKSPIRIYIAAVSTTDSAPYKGKGNLTEYYGGYNEGACADEENSLACKRDRIDQICKNGKQRITSYGYCNKSTSNFKALISFGVDEDDFKASYSVANPNSIGKVISGSLRERRIVSAVSHTVADNYNQLVNLASGALGFAHSLSSADVWSDEAVGDTTNYRYWVGPDVYHVNPENSYTCNNWTSTSLLKKGVVGGNDGINGDQVKCNQTAFLMCLCWD